MMTLGEIHCFFQSASQQQWLWLGTISGEDSPMDGRFPRGDHRGNKDKLPHPAVETCIVADRLTVVCLVCPCPTCWCRNRLVNRAARVSLFLNSHTLLATLKAKLRLQCKCKCAFSILGSVLGCLGGFLQTAQTWANAGVILLSRMSESTTGYTFTPLCGIF